MAGDILILIAAAAISYGGWRVSLRLWPYAPCRWCNGAGTSPGSNRKRLGRCRRCGGSGRRLRRGARER